MKRYGIAASLVLRTINAIDFSTKTYNRPLFTVFRMKTTALFPIKNALTG